MATDYDAVIESPAFDLIESTKYERNSKHCPVQSLSPDNFDMGFRAFGGIHPAFQPYGETSTGPNLIVHFWPAQRTYWKTLIEFSAAFPFSAGSMDANLSANYSNVNNDGVISETIWTRTSSQGSGSFSLRVDVCDLPGAISGDADVYFNPSAAANNDQCAPIAFLIYADNLFGTVDVSVRLRAYKLGTTPNF